MKQSFSWLGELETKPFGEWGCCGPRLRPLFDENEAIGRWEDEGGACTPHATSNSTN